MSWQPKTTEWYLSQLRKEQNKIRDLMHKQTQIKTQASNPMGLGGNSSSSRGMVSFSPEIQIVTKQTDDGTVPVANTWDRIKANTSCLKVQESGTNTNGSNRNPSTTNPTVKWIDGIKQDGQILILTPKEGKTLTLERYGNIDLASNLTVSDNQFVYLQYYADKKTYDGSNNLISTGVFAVMNTATTVSGGASQTLNNLTDPTSINQDLLPNFTAGSVDGSSNPIDQNIGSATLVWADAYIKDVYSTGTIRTPTSDHELQIFTGGGQRLAISDNATSNAGYAELFGVIAGSGNTQTKPEFKTVSTDASPANNDMIGGYAFDGYNAATSRVTYSRIDARSVVITNGAEVGDLRVFLRDGGGNLDPMFEVNHTGILLPTANHATPSTDGSIYKDSSGNVMVRTGGATKSLSTVGTATVSKLDDIGDCTIGSTISANTVLKEYNGGWVDGLIGNNQVASNAAIVTSKLAITNSDFSGVFGSITGIGTQAQTLNMNANNIESVEHLILGVASSSPSTHGSIYAGASEVYIRAGSTTYPIAAKLNSIPATLDDLSDTTIGTPSANTVLKWSGSAWVDGNVLDANIDGTITWAKINKTGSVLNDFGDTSIVNSANTVIRYDSSSSKWVAGQVGNDQVASNAAIVQTKLSLAITNSEVSSGVFGSITGIGTQSQDLNMNTNTIQNVERMDFATYSATPSSNGVLFYDGTDLMARVSGSTVNITQGGGGASTTLNNLGTTSINADLIPQSGKDLGTSGNQWTDLWVDGVAYIDAIGFGTTAMTLPTSDGNANYVLKTNGSGTLSWASVSGASTSFSGFSADADLNMNTRDITNLDRLFFDLTGSDALGASHSGIAADTTGMVFQLPSNDYYTFKIGSDTEFSVSASSVSVSSKRITQLSDPTGDTDALNKQWLCGSSSDIITNTRLGSSPSSSKYLRGDMTWQTVNTGCVGYSGGSNASQSIQLGGYSVEGFGSLSSSSGGGYLKFNGSTKARIDSSGLLMSADINMNNNDIDNCNYIDSNTIICNSTFTSTASSSQFTGSITALYSSTTYLGNSGDTIRIGGQLRFDANTSSDSSPPSSTSGKIAIKVGTSTQYVYYYSS